MFGLSENLQIIIYGVRYFGRPQLHKVILGMAMPNVRIFSMLSVNAGGYMSTKKK